MVFLGDRNRTTAILAVGPPGILPVASVCKAGCRLLGRLGPSRSGQTGSDGLAGEAMYNWIMTMRYAVMMLLVLMMAPWSVMRAEDGSVSGEQKNANVRSVESNRRTTQTVRKKYVWQRRVKRVDGCNDSYCERAARSPWFPKAAGD
jgi:hypothetical protein